MDFLLQYAYNFIEVDLTPLEPQRIWLQIPARDQRTPSQSHSSGSYGETCMGMAERLYRNGWEPFDYLKVSVVQKTR